MTAVKRASLVDSAVVCEFLKAGEESVFRILPGRSSASRRQTC
jgi:hypothetical protein